MGIIHKWRHADLEIFWRKRTVMSTIKYLDGSSDVSQPVVVRAKILSDSCSNAHQKVKFMQIISHKIKFYLNVCLACKFQHKLFKEKML